MTVGGYRTPDPHEQFLREKRQPFGVGYARVWRVAKIARLSGSSRLKQLLPLTPFERCVHRVSIPASLKRAGRPHSIRTLSRLKNPATASCDH